MSIESKKRLGLALCGSYCTFEKLFAAAEKLSDKYELIPIMRTPPRPTPASAQPPST